MLTLIRAGGVTLEAALQRAGSGVAQARLGRALARLGPAQAGAQLRRHEALHLRGTAMRKSCES
jgi:hypothetical protein